MKEKFISTGLACVLLAGGCSTNNEQDNQTDYMAGAPIECVEDHFNNNLKKEDIAIANKRISEAIELANAVDIPEVTEVARYLASRISTDKFSSDKVELFTVYSDRQYSCDYMNFLSQSPAFGVFLNDTVAIALIYDTNLQVNSIWGSLLLLHEAKHAYNYENNDIKSPTEERDTRVFEQKIISEVGGKAYSSALDEVKNIIIDKGFNNKDGWALQTVDLPPVIDEVFGEPLNDADSRMRYSAINIHAIFELVEEQGVKDGLSEIDIKNIQQDVLRQLMGTMGG